MKLQVWDELFSCPIMYKYPETCPWRHLFRKIVQEHHFLLCIASRLKHFRDYFFLHLKPGVDRIGVLTTHTWKLAYVSVMNIMLRDDRIFAVDDTECIDIGKNNTRSMLMDQLSFFGFLFSRPENAFQKEKVPINGTSVGGKDDICMAMLIGIYFVHE